MLTGGAADQGEAVHREHGEDAHTGRCASVTDVCVSMLALVQRS